MSRSSSTRSDLILVDTSARRREKSVPAVFQRLQAARAVNLVSTCPVVTMELLYSARDAYEFATVEREEAELRMLPLTRSVQRAAVGAVRELASRSSGYHRVPFPDVLIAAAAQEMGADVLHYDRHFDRLAEVMHFRSVWLAPAGTLA